MLFMIVIHVSRTYCIVKSKLALLRRSNQRLTIAKSFWSSVLQEVTALLNVDILYLSLPNIFKISLTSSVNSLCIISFTESSISRKQRKHSSVNIHKLVNILCTHVLKSTFSHWLRFAWISYSILRREKSKHAGLSVLRFSVLIWIYWSLIVRICLSIDSVNSRSRLRHFSRSSPLRCITSSVQ